MEPFSLKIISGNLKLGDKTGVETQIEPYLLRQVEKNGDFCGFCVQADLWNNSKEIR